MQVFRFRTFYGEIRRSFEPRDQRVAGRLWAGLAMLLLLALQPQSASAQSAPVANNDLFFTTEGFSVPLSVLANDIDPDGDLDTASLSITAPAAHGTTSINLSTGVITYVPDAHFHGIDEFTYRIRDLSGLSATALVTLLVYPVNDPPLLLPDVDSTLEGSPVFVRVLLNDSDPLDAPLSSINPFTLSIATPPLHGSATALPGVTGRVLYQPSPGFFGVDSFEYSVCDDGHPLPAMCGTAWARVHVFRRVVAAADRSICPGDSVRLTATGPGPYTWSPADGLSCTNCNAPWASPASSTTYTVTSTAGGCCPNSDSITVVVFTPGIVQAITDLAALNEDGSASVSALDNDVLIDGYEFHPLGDPVHGAASWTASGVLTYTPAPDYYGPDSVAYAVCPPACPSSCDTGWVVLDVLPVNDPPIARNDTVWTLEDTPLNIAVLANDTDPDAGLDPGSLSLLLPAQHGSLSADPISGLVTYTPDLDYSGPDSFRYRICDTGFPLPALCDDAWVFIWVEEENDPVSALNDTLDLLEDTPTALNVLLNDSDPEDRIDPASLVVLVAPQHGSSEVLAGGLLRYSPELNYYGPDSLQYQVCDDQFPITCDQAWVLLNVLPVNDPPETVLAVAVTDEDSPVYIDVLAGDSDVDGNLDSTSLAVLSAPLNGSAVADPLTGQVLYTPDPNFFGTDSFTYQICDDGFPLPAACSEGTVIILVLPVNDPPIAADDYFDVLEDSPASLAVLANDTDIDGLPDPASVMVLEGPVHGSALPNPATGEVQYSPNPDYYGPDSFRYRVCDDGIPPLCSEAMVYLQVLPVNDAPLALSDTAYGIQDLPLFSDPLANDSDVDGNLLYSNISLVISPLSGVISLTDSGLIYQPNPGFTGWDSLQYQICDDGFPLPAECASAWLFIHIQEVPPLPNESPVALADSFAVAEDHVLLLDPLANDFDPDGMLVPATLVVVQPPVRATALPDPLTGTVTFTPDADVWGMDSFLYRICDNGPAVACDSAWVRVRVWPVNDAPQARNDTVSTLEDTPIQVYILLNDSDIDGLIDPFTTSLLRAPHHGTASYDPGLGELSYTPSPGFSGLDSLLYAVCDDGFPLPAACDSAWVFIRVQPLILPNAAPVAEPDGLTLWEDSSALVWVLLNDTDPEGALDTLSLSVVEGPHFGSAGLEASALRYTPLPDYYGPDSLRYAICDLGSPVLCDTTWVYLEVLPVNDPPQARDDSASVQAGQSVLIALLANDSDLETGIDPWSLELLREPWHGTWLWDGDAATLTYTAESGFQGADSLLYRVCDLGFPLPARCDSAWVRIAVERERAAEVFYAAPDFISLADGEETAWDVLANDHPDARAACLELLSAPSRGSAELEPNGVLRYRAAEGYAGRDSLRYRVCNGGGLWAEALVQISVRLGGLEIAGGLSPNGDGRNETFRILGLERYPNHRLQIISRRGDLLLDAAPYAGDWDGRYAGKELPEGTYFYLLTLDPAEPGSVLSGHLTLRR
jgi:large repetitive protein